MDTLYIYNTWMDQRQGPLVCSLSSETMVSSFIVQTSSLLLYLTGPCQLQLDRKLIYRLADCPALLIVPQINPN